MIELNEKQRLAYDAVLEGQNVFISGPGGVGKSFLINRMMEHLGGSTVLLAPTGIAALNIGGSTIHSMFGMSKGIMTKGNSHGNTSKRSSQVFAKDGPVKRVIIDEIPMARQDLITAMDAKLRLIRGVNRPFGGLQIIAVGDFYQLPPVVSNQEQEFYSEFYDSPYCFESDSWAQASFKAIELDQVMRQSDAEFIDNLQKIRMCTDDVEDAIRWFNAVAERNVREQDMDDVDPLFLCTTNKMVDKINNLRFDEIEGETKTYRADVTGKISTYPVAETIALKYGTKVVMMANTEDYRNGEVGYVTGMFADMIEVTLDKPGEPVVLVSRYEWEEKEYALVGSELTMDVVGTYKQFPVRLAYAVTIHKCQGMTLDSACIDLGWKAFSSGQTYVALSRVKNLDRLFLNRPIKPKDVFVSPEIKTFYENGCQSTNLF